MDFLSLVAIYLLVWVMGLLCYTYSDHPLLTSRPGRLLNKSFSCVMHFILRTVPSPLKSSCIAASNYLFCQRNHVFQVIYCSLVLAGHVIIVVDVLPLLYHMDSHTNHTFWCLTLLIINAACFSVCCISDPGCISAATLKHYQEIYKADGILYKPYNKCLTCSFIKPPRSKHCAFTDWCVFKFDHFCVWTNNTVGGKNHRYFVCFLVSVVIMSLNAALMALKALVNITVLYQLWNVRYIDGTGRSQPITFPILAQTLFMQYPRLVFLTVSLAVVTAIMTCFTGYHVYLTLTNQTTNERYKRYYLHKAGHRLACNPYNKGLLKNIMEDLFPLCCTKRPSHQNKVK